MSVLSEEVVEINCEGLFILQRKVLGDSSVKRGSNIDNYPVYRLNSHQRRQKLSSLHLGYVDKLV